MVSRDGRVGLKPQARPIVSLGLKHASQIAVRLGIVGGDLNRAKQLVDRRGDVGAQRTLDMVGFEVRDIPRCAEG